MRTGVILLFSPFLMAACATQQPTTTPAASKLGSEPAEVVAQPAPAPAKASAALDWKRLEAAVAEAAKDRRIKYAPDKLHDMAAAYARDINRIPVEHMKQYHINRAALVLERDVFSGETLAEGAALRATVNGGGGGGSSRGSRNTRDVGRTSRSNNSSSNSGTSNRSNNNSSNNNSGF